MRELLCSVVLLLSIGAGYGSTVGQEYEERPRPTRHPVVTFKAVAKESPSTTTASLVKDSGKDVERVTPNPSSAGDRRESGAASDGGAAIGIVPAETGGSTPSASALSPTNENTTVASSSTRIDATSGETGLKLSSGSVSEPSSGAATSSSNTAVSLTTTPAVPAVSLTNIYRVGEGDILDIRILNYEVQSASTLYTVLGGGLLEYPLVGDPLPVTGLTTDEIDEKLTAELKRREVFESPVVIVSVRDYVSHTTTVTGMVENPGAKTLRREALPLYVVLAEAVPRSEAGQVVITTPATGASRTVDLTDVVASNSLVHAGDVLRVMARAPQFFYIGGAIGAPGQKDFHAGLTLTQAVLAAGGTIRGSNVRVRVARQGDDGRLVSSEYNLKDIEAGKNPDPALQAGDRIELTRK